MNSRHCAVLSPADMEFLDIRFNDFYNNRFNVDLNRFQEPVGENGNIDLDPLFNRSSFVQILSPDRMLNDTRTCRIYEGFIGDSIWTEIENEEYNQIANTIHIYDFLFDVQGVLEPGFRNGIEWSFDELIWHTTSDSVIPSYLITAVQNVLPAI